MDGAVKDVYLIYDTYEGLEKSYGPVDAAETGYNEGKVNLSGYGLYIGMKLGF